MSLSPDELADLYGDFVILAPGVQPTHDSETIYGSSRGVGVVRTGDVQYLVSWNAGLLGGGHKNWRYKGELVFLSHEQKVEHLRWIRGDETVAPVATAVFEESEDWNEALIP